MQNTGVVEEAKHHVAYLKKTNPVQQNNRENTRLQKVWKSSEASVKPR